jgi:hypothetical protein
MDLDRGLLRRSYLMKHSTTRWTTALAAFALLGLPAAGWSQPPSPSTTSQQPPAAAGPEQHGAAQEHIRQAQAALNDVQTASLQGKPKSKVTELKRHLNSLEKSTASASTTASKPAARGKDKWATDVSAIDKILTELLGPATTSAASVPAGATGTAGKTTATSLTLDETTKAKLMEVRTHVTAFAASMSGAGAAAPKTGEPSSTPAAAAAATTAQPTATPAAAAAATTAQPTATPAAQPQATPPADPPAQPSTQSAAAPTSATAPSPAQAQEPPVGTAQVDPEGAKRHATAARDTLGQLTKLPAAAQVQGDARTQLSQLITNFNELITTTENWRSSYDKVNANVVALLGPETPEPSQPPAAGVPGAVGTSGTATLDPAVRAKLVEFRNHLTQFEKASGANTPAAPAATAAAVVPATAPPGSPATEQSAAPPQRSEVMGQTSALVHIDAIEAILKPRATASAQTPAGATAATGLTLDPTQVEQLRTHLAELRKAIEKK